jgi:type VI secretion system protein VasD
MRHRFHRLTILVATIVTIGLVDCAPSPPKDVKLSGAIVAAADVNLDPEGRPSPIVVRIYQLQSVTKFNNADFFALYDDAAGALGADMIAFDEFTLRPGQSLDYQAQVKPSAKFIGALAAFRDINSAQWRADLELPEKPGRLSIKLDKMSVSASLEE